ncbi:PAS domain S-box protein [Chryseolinea sp. H1M3-3]|uniref:PAS domain-containing sensor histidine kinase n=1 Tax=Chryseolinea sp. H1M3-3 TaxID=3034144 RepID=UPI0023ED937B|nr:PAS domain S-box protein [Chryseolinea sp. H1M3-3]
MNDDKAVRFSSSLVILNQEARDLIARKNWKDSPLGDIKTWSGHLNFSVSLCLNATQPVALWWSSELVIFYNEAFRDLFCVDHPRLFGSKGEQIGSKFWDVLSPSLKSVLKNGKATVAQQITHENAGIPKEHSFVFHNTPVFEDGGKVGGVFTAVLENTKAIFSQKMLQKIEEDEARLKILIEQNEELKKSEDRYVRMTEEILDYAIILLDKDGSILNWNRGAEKIKGYSESEIIGKNFSIFYLDEDRQNGLPVELISRAKQEGRAMHEGWRKRKDGSKFWGSIVITALHDEKNNVIGFTKVTRDLTERKIAEDKMRQHALELEVKNKQLEQFAYIASHDLQEPLRKIQTFVQVLEMKLNDPEARKKYFERINSSAKRMSALIQSVLNYSRISQHGELFTTIDLNAILENAISDYELVISEKDAIIQRDNLPTIKGIPLQMSQLFSNLLSNSLKFSKGQPVVKISSSQVTGKEIVRLFPSVDTAQPYVKIVFADNGIGFDQRYADKIFTIFQRLHSRDEYAGTGIGLALCKRIVDNHFGYIAAKGEAGKGSTFTIYLPLE